MIIFRIEDDNGCGFVFGNHQYGLPIELEYDYIYDDIIDKNGRLTERQQHPDADYDTPLAEAYFNNLIFVGSPLIFGFANVKDLYTWISPATLGVCELNGYYIHIYDVPEKYVIQGTRQVAFDSNYYTSKCKISHKKLRRGLKSLGF